VFDAFEDRLYFREQPPAGLRQRHTARGAIEQPHPEAFLERADGLAHRGQRDPNLGGRLGETAVLRDRREGGQFGELKAGHSLLIPNKLFRLFGLIEMPTSAQVQVRAATFR